MLVEQSPQPFIDTGVPVAGTFPHLRSSLDQHILLPPHGCLADAI
jgi:hypothetical protein